MKNKYQFIFVMLFIFTFQSGFADEPKNGDPVRLSLKPKECVVFKEGDKCYAKVSANWSTKEPGSFCLFRTPDTKLECWNGPNEGRYTEDLVMSEAVDYYLVRVDSSEVVVRKTVELSWVYKKTTRLEHTWRLF